MLPATSSRRARPLRTHNIFGVQSSLSIKQVKAAQHLALGELTIGQIAEKLEVSQSAIFAWQRELEAFKSAIVSFRETYAHQTMEHGIALKLQRQRALQKAIERMQGIMDERAKFHRAAIERHRRYLNAGYDGATPEEIKAIREAIASEGAMVQAAPGMDSGYMVHARKYTAQGFAIDEFKFDSEFYKLYLKTIEQAAKEQNDAYTPGSQTAQPAGAGNGVTFHISFPVVDPAHALQSPPPVIDLSPNRKALPQFNRAPEETK